MEPTPNDRKARRVRLETSHGPIEGTLMVAPALRTLDELNIVSRNFVTVYEAEVLGSDWFLKDALCVRRSSVLFVRELSNPPARSGGAATGAFTRASLRLRVGAWNVEGFVHVPAGGVALKRLNQGNHPFISITSVSAIGPESQFAAPFLAVNLEHVLAAQELLDLPVATEELAMSFEVGD